MVLHNKIYRSIFSERDRSLIKRPRKLKSSPWVSRRNLSVSKNDSKIKCWEALAKRVQYSQDGPRVASILNETVCRDPVSLFAYCYLTYCCFCQYKMVFATMPSSSNLGNDHQKGIVRNNLLVLDISGLNLGKLQIPRSDWKVHMECKVLSLYI